MALQGRIRYVITATLSEQNEVKMAAESEVKVYRTPMTEAFKPAQYAGLKQVGGYFGFNMQPTHSEFSIKSSSYAPGDQAPIELSQRNGESCHSIDCFKFKLFRKIEYMVDGKLQETCEYLNYEKISGCKKFENVEKQYNAQIPEFELDGKTPLLGSTQSPNFTVAYYMRVFTKIKSIFEVGEGKCVQFPIYIIPKPTEVEEFQLDPQFKTVGLPIEFEEGTSEIDGTSAMFDYVRDQWMKVNEPNAVPDYFAH